MMPFTLCMTVTLTELYPFIPVLTFAVIVWHVFKGYN